MNKEDASREITGILLELYSEGRLSDKELTDYSIKVANIIESVEVIA